MRDSSSFYVSLVKSEPVGVIPSSLDNYYYYYYSASVFSSSSTKFGSFSSSLELDFGIQEAKLGFLFPCISISNS